MASLLAWFLAGLAPAACIAETLTIGRLAEASALADISERVAEEAFRRAGLTLVIKPLPIARSIEDANAGTIDGDLMRIAEVAGKYPNLIAVPTPINRVDVMVYGASPAIRNKTRADIAKLKIAYSRGVLVLVKTTRGLAATEGQSVEATFDMLHNGRVDAVMVADLVVEARLQEHPLPDIVTWPHVWASEPLYLYLNRRHAALVPRLDAALQQMKQQGLIDKVYADWLHRLKIVPPPGR